MTERYIPYYNINFGPVCDAVPKITSIASAYSVCHNCKILFYFPDLKIHVSQECKSILDVLGGYTVEHRGLVNMKVTNRLGGLSNKKKREKLEVVG